MRWAFCLLAVASTLPYLTLKVVWLAGGRVGLNDPEFGRSAVMYAANAITFGLELAAVALALIFVLPFGRRLPPWLVLIPMWVGTGFLAQILVTLPLQLIDGAPAESSTEEGPIADWVFAVVYAGFAALGVFLLCGFVLYAHERWGRHGGWTAPLSGRSVGRTEKVVALWAVAGLLVSGVLLVVRATGPLDLAAANLIGDALMALAGIVGLLLLAYGASVWLPRWVPIVLAWTGTAAVTVWSAYFLVLVTVPNELLGDASVTWADQVSELIRFGAGLAAAAAGLRLSR